MMKARRLPRRAQRATPDLACRHAHLLEAFTHTFYEGELWCVAGPNGAGKTTLLATLAGLLQPSAGQVELDGVRPPTGNRCRSRNAAR